jgi:hypothetical protein
MRSLRLPVRAGGIPLGSLVLLASMLLAPREADAQNRTRRTGEFAVSGASIEVRGTTMGVYLDASRGADFVGVSGKPAEMRVWADSALALMRATLRAAPGEEVEYTAQTAGYGDRMALERIVTSSGSRYLLMFADEYTINYMSLPVTPTRMQALIRAVVQAADASDAYRQPPVAAAYEVDSVGTRPSLAPESRQMLADSIAGLHAGQFASHAVLEVVVAPDGSVDPASVAAVGVSGGYALKEMLARIAPRLRFAPGTRRGQPVRVRVRMPFVAQPRP